MHHLIDEFDAVGQKRAGQTGTEEGVDELVATINQFLAEMDGFERKSWRHARCHDR